MTDVDRKGQAEIDSGPDPMAGARDSLETVIEDMEAVDWRHVPGFSMAEAAALQRKFRQSQAALEEDT